MLEFILNTNLAIPMIQLVLLMLMSTISLLFGKLRLALIINYVFILHWGYISNRDNLVEMGFENFELVSLIYFMFGLGIILVASFAFLFQKSE
jgi:hypothetical protein